MVIIDGFIGIDKKVRCDMLLEFQVENYLSFKERTKLSMVASSIKELPEAVFTVDKYELLRSAAIFGANASGKSNLLKAIGFMKEFVLKSAKESTFGKDIEVNNFKLSEETLDKPSTFEMTFIVPDDHEYSKTGNIVFRYGFKVDREMVKAEWLFARFTAFESTLFTRLGDEITISEKFKEGKQVKKALGKINKSTLFLSQVAAIKGENALLASMIMECFDDLRDISTIANDNFIGITADLMDNDQNKAEIVKALSLADMCIEDIIVNKEKLNIEKLPDDMKDLLTDKEIKNIFRVHLDTLHKVFDKDKKVTGRVVFDFSENESDGSKKFFAIIGPILSALENGLILVIDEIDARLHPNLCLLIITLFNSKKTNSKGAQLIFATHNTLMMDKRFLRRDQIYLIEKDKYGASELYSLLDYKNVRNDASYNKDYLMGKYGAVPYLGNFETLFTEER
ncbi:MAG: ATP-binding protein [Candidatus Tenebribacter davisii]|nr:ATP-binding protein [Candidatus Tenebribacter davisii]